MFKSIEGLITTLFFCAVFTFVNAQNVGINETGAPADESAILELDSENKGFLPPRMTLSQRNNITNPAEGLMVYNTTDNCLEIYTDSNWESIHCAGSSSTHNCDVYESLATTHAAGNGQSGNMFDVNALENITIIDFEVRGYSATSDFDVYYKNGSHVGSENTPGDWTLLANVPNLETINGQTTPLGLNLGLELDAGQTYSFYITRNTSSVNYTNGNNVGDLHVSNPDLEVLEGVGKNHAFGATYSPRIWNGVIQYCK